MRGLVFLIAAGQALGSEVAYVEPELEAADREHWAFRRVVPVAVPEAGGGRNGVDAFLLRRLGEAGLGFAGEAGREVLLRRVTFDLTGLPPSPEEVEGFLADRAEGAYGRVVERLLASPRYGERWAQHWLDVARFAESDGFEHDKVRGEAWRYRDWVIGALNADLGYDEFVREQVAGSGDGSGFLVCGPDMPDINDNEERRHLVLNEMTSTVGAAFLGLTMRCASCHDHKSDPVSQADFYRMRGFFESFAMPAKNRQLPARMVEGAARRGHLMVRGDFRRRGMELEAGFVRVADPGGGRVRGGTELRGELAAWMTEGGNPLVARVAVNRLWQGHFGRGLVGTPNDFGVLGERPTHPELLDWLAGELVRGGWSLKAMHRLLVTSAAYRQVSFASGGEAIDPGNRLLWRMNRRRLSGEEVRDAMLAASGRLNEKRGGPGVRPPLPPEVTVTLLKNQWPVTEGEPEHARRSVYLFARRNLKFPMFDVFDRPEGNASCGRRHVSTTATQALTQMNSAFSWEMAGALADRVRGEGEAVVRAFERVMGRAPDAEEVAMGKALVEAASLEDYCLGLFNLNGFLYVE